MKTFIFYSPDGTTIDMEGNNVENYQVLGWAEAKTAKKAFKKFKEENTWAKFETVYAQEVQGEKYEFSI